MRNLVKLFLALVMAGFCAEVACAQTTTVTAAAGSIAIGSSPIASGTAVFVPVDGNGNGIVVTKSGGGLSLPANSPATSSDPIGFSCTITAGAITGGCSVPDAGTSSPSGFAYNITIADTSTGNLTSGQYAKLTQVHNVTGSTWPLDHYSPLASVSIAGLFTATQGIGPPTGTAPNGAFYTDTTIPTSPVFYEGVNGAWAQISIPAGSGSITFGTTAGTSAQGNDSRITGAAQKAANLSDLASATSARANLGLGSAAVSAASAFDAAGAATTAQAAAIASAASTSLQRANNGSDIASVTAFRSNLTLNPFNTGNVVGPGAGSSLWYTAAESGGSTIDTVQGFVTYWLPTASSTIQVEFGNTGQIGETTCGPNMIIDAAIQYPVDGQNVPLFFNGARNVTISPCGSAISDPIAIDTTATSQLVQVRYRAARASTDSTVFQANWVFGLTVGSTMLAPYTTTKTGGAWDAAEELRTRTVADGVMTSGSAVLTSATAAFVAQDGGQTITVNGAGASGANLATTILTVTNATTVTLSTSAGTTVSGATVSIVPADKTLSGTIITGTAGGRVAYAPHALFAKPTGNVKTVGLVGDSITFGTGSSTTALLSNMGSWAVQSLNQSGVSAGLATAIATAIPYTNESMPGETALNISTTTKHTSRFSLLARDKYILGILGANDFVSGGETAVQMEAYLTIIATNESQRGSLPYYGTIPPRNLSTDGYLTLANQTPNPADAIRVAYNSWLRDGAPTSDSTGLPVAVGSSVSTTNRSVYYIGGVAQINPTSGVATASGPHPVYNLALGGGNPFAGIFEFANIVESSFNSGIWKVDPGVTTVTGCSMTAASNVLTCTGGAFTSGIVNTIIAVPGAGASGVADVAFVTAFTSATVVTLGIPASTTVSGVSVTVDACVQTSTSCGRFTQDGTHPSPRGHHDIGVVVGSMVAGWTF
jgi:hypothetical protein